MKIHKVKFRIKDWTIKRTIHKMRSLAMKPIKKVIIKDDYYTYILTEKNDDIYNYKVIQDDNPTKMIIVEQIVKENPIFKFKLDFTK